MKGQTQPWQTELRYVREFSALGSMQAEHWIHYCLAWADGAWQMQLRQLYPNKGPQSEQVFLQCSGTMAYHVLRFLYENAVPLENWKDVLEDLLPAEMIQG